MKKTQSLFSPYKWVIALFLISVFLTKSYCQKGSAFGTITFTEELPGWTKINCKTDYYFELKDNNILFFTSNYEMTIAGDAKFRYEGKEYSKADLGLSNWPTKSEANTIYASLNIKYKGETLKSYQSHQLVSYALKIGAFHNYDKNGNKSASVGNRNIPFEGFNISDFSASISNFSGARNSMIASSEIEALIKSKTSTDKSNNTNNNSYNIGNNNTGKDTNAKILSENQRINVDQQNKNDQIKKATELANEQINANRLAIEARQKETEAQVNAAVDGVGQFVTGIMANAEASRERKYESDRKILESQENNRKKGEILIQNFSVLANQGNENAIEKVAEGYSLIENPYKYYREIMYDEYPRSYPKKYVTFLENMYNRYNSKAAQKELIKHYDDISKSFNICAKDHKRKAIVQPIVGGVFIAGGIIGSDELYKSEDEDHTLSTAVGAVGVLGGGVLVFSGIIHLVRIGQTNNDKDYIEAKNKIKDLKNKNKLSFAPNYDIQNRSLGFAVRFKY